MSTVLQVRLDEDLKDQATIVYEQLGLDLSSAVRMFLKKSVAVNGIPFDVRNGTETKKTFTAVNNMRSFAEDSGLSDLSLDEINDIIRKTRNDRKKKE